MNRSSLYSISQAAHIIGVSTKTLKRWESSGLVNPIRDIHNHRLYDAAALRHLSRQKGKLLPSANYSNKFLTISQTAKKLKVSIKTIRRWEKAGILTCTRNTQNQRLFSQEAVESVIDQKKQVGFSSQLFQYRFNPAIAPSVIVICIITYIAGMIWSKPNDISTYKDNAAITKYSLTLDGHIIPSSSSNLLTNPPDHINSSLTQHALPTIYNPDPIPTLPTTTINPHIPALNTTSTLATPDSLPDSLPIINQQGIPQNFTPDTKDNNPPKGIFNIGNE